jgi:hypothetical protein
MIKYFKKISFHKNRNIYTNNFFNFSSKHVKNEKGEAKIEKNNTNANANSDAFTVLREEVKITTIDLGEPVTNNENNMKIRDIYDIKYKKMGAPDINKLIDKSKFVNKNVKLSVYSHEEYEKNPLADQNLIPVSAKIGPFEVRRFYNHFR